MKKLILSVIAIVSCDVCFSQKDHSTRETLLFSEINDYRNSLGIEDVEYDSVAYLVAKRQSGYQSKLDSLTANQNIDIPNFEESATFEEAIEKITKVKTIGGMLCARIYEKNGTIQRTDLEIIEKALTFWKNDILSSYALQLNSTINSEEWGAAIAMSSNSTGAIYITFLIYQK